MKLAECPDMGYRVPVYDPYSAWTYMGYGVPGRIQAPRVTPRARHGDHYDMDEVLMGSLASGISACVRVRACYSDCRHSAIMGGTWSNGWCMVGRDIGRNLSFYGA